MDDLCLRNVFPAGPAVAAENKPSGEEGPSLRETAARTFLSQAANQQGPF